MGKWLIFLAALIAVIIGECIREVFTFRVVHYQVQSPKLKHVKNRRVILLSDLHGCSYGKNNQKLLSAICREKPDLILIAGDMLVAEDYSSDKVANDFTEKLAAICDTYYVNGNHEQKRKAAKDPSDSSYRDYKDRLSRAGIIFLENEKTDLSWDDLDVQVCGLELPREAYRKFYKCVLPENYLTDSLGQADSDKFEILMAHTPAFTKEYLKWGADLVVSGHFHGGMVRIPFWRGVITPQGRLFPKYSGEMTKEGDATVVVSKGIGMHTFKIRLFNPTELVVLQLGDLEE